jgi:Transposase Tn5 dimerisation domain
MEAAPTRGQREVQIPQRQGRTARMATLEIRSAQVVLKRPKLLAHQDAQKPVEVHVLYAKEANPPEGTDGLEWLLLTSEPVETEAEINRVLGIYEKRWKIEEYHKAWKSGTKVEELRQQRAENLKKVAVILGFIAVRLLQLKVKMETTPEAPCEQVLCPIEWKVLWTTCEKGKPLPTEVPSMQWAYRAIARLGHWSDTKRTGRASWDTLWNGWQRLSDHLLGYRVAQRLSDEKM